MRVQVICVRTRVISLIMKVKPVSHSLWLSSGSVPSKAVFNYFCIFSATWEVSLCNKHLLCLCFHFSKKKSHLLKYSLKWSSPHSRLSVLKWSRKCWLFFLSQGHCYTLSVLNKIREAVLIIYYNIIIHIIILEQD